LKDF